ncbi:MAG: ATP-binding protein [Deltaproteobacteria bacterium]|nr:ATP-binding protein [Deltaproteobacteria bacterium]
MATEKSSAVTQIRPEAKAPEPWKCLKFAPAWVETRNEQEFLARMETIAQMAGKGCLDYIWGPAGEGKTDTSAIHAAAHRLPHIRVREDWKNSTLPFLMRLCRELGQETPQRNRSRCIDWAIEHLLQRPAKQRVVFIDEADRIPKHLDLMRDLADLSGAAFILIGELKMDEVMRANSRLWSRSLGGVRFEAVEAQAIMNYGWKSAELKIEPAAALLLNQAPYGGDWRMIRNRTVKLVSLANAKKTSRITEDLARLILDEEPAGGR